MATTLMDQYMKMTGTAFVHTAVEGVITKIVEMKQSCEVVPYVFFLPNKLPFLMGTLL